MLQKNRRYKVLLNMLFEAGIIFISYKIATLIRFSLMHGVENPVQRSLATSPLLILYCLCIVVLFYLFHLYIPVHQLNLGRELTKVALLGAFSVLTLGALFSFCVTRTFPAFLCLYSIWFLQRY